MKTMITDEQIANATTAFEQEIAQKIVVTNLQVLALFNGLSVGETIVAGKLHFVDCVLYLRKIRPTASLRDLKVVGELILGTVKITDLKTTWQDVLRKSHQNIGW